MNVTGVPWVFLLLGGDVEQLRYPPRLAAQLFALQAAQFFCGSFGCAHVLLGGVVDGQLHGGSRRFRAIAVNLRA
jgi:hypothetical protein